MALTLLGVLVYANHFHNTFQFDSVAYITNNLNLKNPESMLTVQFWITEFFARGLLRISMGYNAYLDGLRPFGYHVFNLALHIFNAILVFYIFQKALIHFKNLDRQVSSNTSISFFAAVIFMVHPIQTESVIYIISRSEVMAATFYLLGFLLFQICLDLDKHRLFLKYLLLPLVLILIALVGFSVKQTLATFPLILVLYFLFISPPDSSAIQLLKKYNWQVILIFSIFIGLLFHKLLSDETFLIGPSKPEEMVGRAKYMLSQPVVIVYYYFNKILFPFNLNIDPDIEIVASLASLKFISSLVGIALIFWFSLRKVAWRLFIFFLCWFFIILSPSSSIVTLHDLAAEHRVYLATPGMIFIFTYAVFGLFKNSASIAANHKGIFAVSVFCSLVLIFGVLSSKRNSIWQTELTLWQDTYKKSPNKLRPLINLARAHSIEGNTQQSIRYYEESFAKDPYIFVVNYNLGELYLNEGRTEEAIKRFETALRIDPEIPETYSKLGEIYLSQKDWKKADFYFKKCIEINPRMSQVFKNLGVLHLYHLQNLKESLVYFSRSLTLDPTQKEADKIRQIMIQISSKEN